MKIGKWIGSMRYWLITNVLVNIYSIPARLTILFSGKRGLFVDCGSNLGQGFAFFRRFYKDRYFDYDLFEPNPDCYSHLLGMISNNGIGRITLHNKAVGISENITKFYGTSSNEGGRISEGGSILKLHNSNYYNASDETAIEVEQIRFSSFIKSKLNEYGCIVIKIDIESGEYAVIQDMIDCGLFDHITTLYVEFHSKYMVEPDRNIYDEKEKQYIKYFSKIKCRLHIWH